jgi:hypothetical protein
MNTIKEEMIRVSKMGLTDKADYHAYEELYPELLNPYLGKNNNILEVGTAKGGGLIFLSNCFPESTIFGLDHNYSPIEVDLEGRNVKLIKETDQADPSFIDGLPNIDIVIEDASHNPALSIKTFEILLPKLNIGSIYIIEDVYPEFKDFYISDGRFEVIDISHIKNRGDDIVAIHRKK